MFHVFGTEYSFGQMLLSAVLLPAAIFGFIVMSMVAIFQTDLRRMLAYSSIAQIGYILAGISMMSINGLSAAMIHMINHGLIKSALFMATGCFLYRLGSVHINSLGRLISTMPLSSAAFAFAGVSLVGLPLTAGFISKWSLISAALDKGWWWLAALVLLSSIMAIIYMGRFIQMICFSNNVSNTVDTQGNELKEAPAIMWLSTWALLLFTLYLGLNSSGLIDLTQQAATQMFGGMK
jgi:multicomponent Na+:H+ antiporter subunit D